MCSIRGCNGTKRLSPWPHQVDDALDRSAVPPAVSPQKSACVCLRLERVTAPPRPAPGLLKVEDALLRELPDQPDLAPERRKCKRCALCASTAPALQKRGLPGAAAPDFWRQKGGDGRGGGASPHSAQGSDFGCEESSGGLACEGPSAEGVPALPASPNAEAQAQKYLSSLFNLYTTPHFSAFKLRIIDDLLALCLARRGRTHCYDMTRIACRCHWLLWLQTLKEVWIQSGHEKCGQDLSSVRVAWRIKLHQHLTIGFRARCLRPLLYVPVSI